MAQLLISVQNAREAALAVRGGCDVLDIKNPRVGSLGRAENAVIAEILGTVQPQPVQSRPQSRLSLALGELTEWTTSREVPPEWNAFDYFKAGPAGIANWQTWLEQFSALQQQMQNAGVTQPGWIAVFYADYGPAASFDCWYQFANIGHFIDQLRSLGCVGILLDTWDKTGASLRELLQIHSVEYLPVLQRLLNACQEHGFQTALAGRLTQADIQWLLQQKLSPCLFAVRSAVCEAQQRRGNLSLSQVENLRKQLQQTEIG